MTARELNTLVRSLNTTHGYTNRYALQRRAATRETGQNVWAIFKAIGGDPQRRHANVSGWLKAGEVAAWIRGQIDGYETAIRRVSRHDRTVTIARMEGCA